MRFVQLFFQNTWSIAFGLLIIAISLWFRWRRKRFCTFKELGIPGPEPNILFGNLWEMSKKTPFVCHKEWIEKYGKVLGYYYGGTPTLLVADVEIAKNILVKDFQNFQNRAFALGNTPKPTKQDPFSHRLTVLKDNRWKEVRRIITPSFTTCKMRMMPEVINGAVDSFMDILDQKSRDTASFDIFKVFQGLTMDAVGRTAFGIQTDCQNNREGFIMKASRAMFTENLANIFHIIELSFPEMWELWKYVKKFRQMTRNEGRNPFSDLAAIVKNVMDGRKSKNSFRQDLLQIMLDASISESDLNKIKDDQLTACENESDDQIRKTGMINGSTSPLRYMEEIEIIGNSILFFVAAYETTSTILAMIAHFLMNHPDVQKKVREEIRENVEREGEFNYNAMQKLHYLDQVIYESLRMHPPLYSFVNREALEDVQYGPYRIKKGMSIQISSHYMNNDPDLWPEPDTFDPDRFSPENKAKRNSMAFMSFGAGPRNCVGIRFALLNLKLALSRMLGKYELLCTEESEVDPALKFSIHLASPIKGIRVKIRPA